MPNIDPAELAWCHQHIRRTGNFTVSLVSRRHADFEPEDKLPAHRNVLLPALNVATECWVYDIRKSSPAYRVAAKILTASKGKYLVNTMGDSVTGRERFWNVQGGERGTIVIVVPAAKFNAKEIFSACYGAWVFDNFLVGHTPSAARLARQQSATGKHVCLCLPRNNGIEWMEVFAKPSSAERLFDIALRSVKRR
jgi:hypothetical protein